MGKFDKYKLTGISLRWFTPEGDYLLSSDAGTGIPLLNLYLRIATIHNSRIATDGNQLWQRVIRDDPMGSPTMIWEPVAREECFSSKKWEEIKLAVAAKTTG
jgi:hypothetical protein